MFKLHSYRCNVISDISMLPTSYNNLKKKLLMKIQKYIITKISNFLKN